ncbi:MAG: type I-C CRISPR-associated protein Cas5c [Lachnospiraceae bacterium]|nr:type I-C CRISPR-associated protein Cas5c [Lachnospiraceae bacterium]
MSVMFEVWGEYAAFNRPEFKTERVTYDCITPSAARGILEAIYWHPGLKYSIDEIYVCNPVQTTNIRRNEVKDKISINNVRKVMNSGKKDTLYLTTASSIQQRAALVLKNVRYVIKAHFDMTSKANETDNTGKFQDILKRRLQKGQCYHTPYLGVREFPAYFNIWDKERKVPTAYKGEKDLGYMLYDMDYQGESGIEPMFFHAVLKDGKLDLKDCEVLK